ncbi:MAG: DJ-1/PfpI family protein [Pseudoclavibacter sp.]
MMASSPRSPRVVFVLPPGVQLLDLAGPAQVFDTVGEVADVSWRLDYVAETARVQSSQGLTVSARTDWPDLSAADLIVVPGWRVRAGRTALRLTAGTLNRIAAHHRRGGTVMSVCAGAFALAAAGLLDGHRATTHHELQDELARRHPLVQVVHDVLFVEDGRLLTSAGIASGIDLALHVVAERLGPRIAARAARAMVVAARRNGAAPQESAMLRYRNHLDDLVHRAQDLIDARFDERLPLAGLAASLAVSERTLTRAFARSIGMSPLRYQRLLRLERARALISAGATAEAAAREAGFSDARMLRRLQAGSSSGPYASAH